MHVERLWWREVRPIDLFGMERSLMSGLRGNKVVVEIEQAKDLLSLAGLDRQTAPDAWPVITLDLRILGSPDQRGELTFRPMPRRGVYGIDMTQLRTGMFEHHPAWSLDWGWPHGKSPNTPEEARDMLEQMGGLRMYIVKTTDDTYYGGIAVGSTLPQGWPEAVRPMFDGKAEGYLEFIAAPPEELSPLALRILEAFGKSKNVLIYGPPGTGKTHAAAQVRRYLDQTSTGSETLVLATDDIFRPFRDNLSKSPLPAPVLTDWVTFHQEYGYEDFIIGLRPTGEGMRLAPFTGRLLDLAIEVDRMHRGSGVLVIDEINRGNVAKILGDFMTYMDETYRKKSNGDISTAVPTALSKVQRSPTGDPVTEPIWMISGDSYMLPQPWYFPENLFILATMNSVDRAIAPLDSAIGRRFERLEAFADLDDLARRLGVNLVHLRNHGVQPIDEDSFSTDSTGLPWSPQVASLALLNYLNDEIVERIGPDFELGHLYFWNVSSWGDLARVWDYEVWPQLRDRFGVRPDQLGDVLRVHEPNQPKHYPFRLRRENGRAIKVHSVQDLSERDIAETFHFLAFG